MRTLRVTAAGAPGMPGADGVVVAVEEVAPAGIGRLVGQGSIGAGPHGSAAAWLQGRPQQKLLKEPGGVTQMPLGRTGIGHSLQAEILRFEGGDQGLAAGPHLSEPGAQGCGQGGQGGAGGSGLRACGTHPTGQKAI